jgi:chemotaxis protein histidine kinase CheA
MGVSSETLQRELRAVFANEAAGSLARVESLLDRPALPDGREVLEALFREFHTMKVGAAAAGYSLAARVLHDAESLLDAVRGGPGIRAPDDLATLRRAVERVRGEMADAPSSAGAEVTLRGLWPLLARTSATAAAAEGKLVALDLGGGGVVFDGRAGAALRGALLHLVRNAVAHGIETPAARQAAGKPRVGRILVAAQADPPRLSVAVSDDGRGLDRAAIAAAAAQSGRSGRAEDLVLEAGLSTRDGVDALAGRGVGLDAVAATARELGGTVTVESRDGQGCTIRLDLPVGDASAEPPPSPVPRQERRKRRGRR